MLHKYYMKYDMESTAHFSYHSRGTESSKAPSCGYFKTNSLWVVFSTCDNSTPEIIAPQAFQ